MGLGINSNIGAVRGARQVGQTNNLLAKNLEKLSSLQRINRAADDAAGLAIAERFNTQARQQQVEIGNLQSGLNAAQTADSGLSTQQDAVQRIRELSVQASNGTLSDDQRAALNTEAQQLIEQINDTGANTTFNDQNLLDADRTIDLGAGGNQLELEASNAASLGVDSVDLSTQAGAQAALEATTQAQNALDENRSNVGAQSNRFESAISNLENSRVNALDAESRIRDLDVAQASIERSRNDVLLQSGLSSLVQSNVTPQSALRLLGS